jgi:hypothetical protein
MSDAEKQRAVRAARHAAGLCRYCGRPRDADRGRCPACFESNRRSVKKTQARRRSAGECISCRRPNPTHFRHCPECRRKTAEYQAALQARRKEDGKCISCGRDDPLETETMCAVCAERLRRVNLRRKCQGPSWQPGKPGRPPKSAQSPPTPMNAPGL